MLLLVFCSLVTVAVGGDFAGLIPSGNGPGNLDTGKEFCISDCASEKDFLATYRTGLLNNEQKLCENEVTGAITGRGGAQCRVDDWFVVEECDINCYEFCWRASYPTYCNVEDRWLWCCSLKITIEPVTLCGEYQERDVACLVQDYWPIIDTIAITWVDEDGNNLAGVDGYDISETYIIDDDKVLSVLTVKSSAIKEPWAEVTCQVTKAGQEAVYEESTMVYKYNVVMSDWDIKKKGAGTTMTCRGEGAIDDAFSFVWYYIDESGDKQVADDETKFSVAEELVDGEWVSTLTVLEAGQKLGDQVFQCVLSHDDVDRCGIVYESVCSGGTGFTIWDITGDTYCAHPGEEAVLEFTILGTNKFFTIDQGVVESVDKGTVITTDTLPEVGYQITGTRNDNGELEVTLTVSPSQTTEIGSEFFVSYRKDEEPEEDLEPNLELNVMDLVGGQSEGASVTPGESDVVVYAEVIGGFMEPPIWVDDKGRIYKPGENDEGVVVELSEDKKSTTLTIPKESVKELGIINLYVSTRLFSETGTYCRRQRVFIELLGDVCKVVWDEPECPEVKSCSDFVHARTWSCVCSSGPNDPSRCVEPTENLYFSCSATVDYELGPWEEEVCNLDACYPYPLLKSRSCECEDIGGVHADASGKKCHETELEKTYYCPPTKPWLPGPWILGECPTESCFESDAVDTRDCYCDGNTDRSKCEEDLVKVRTCPPTKVFEWSPWGEEVCETVDRCYPSQEVKNRNCECENYGTVYTDPRMCEGESGALHTCAANMEWYPEEVGNPCSESETQSCSAFTAIQRYRCKCDIDNESKVDDNLELCDAPELRPKLCHANQPYEWSEWVPASECSLCYPELDQTFTRTCGCGEKVDPTRCEGPSMKSEPCPAPRIRTWLPTEWSEIPCGKLSCHSETFTTRTRECECEGSKDITRCEEPMIDTVSCGYKPYELTIWADTECDSKLCHPYTKTKARSCQCVDELGPSTDLSKCDPGEEGYEEDFDCGGFSYDWGEWQSRGCPDSCISTKTKRYRICSCLGDVNFNECGDGSAIEFFDCEPTRECQQFGP